MANGVITHNQFMLTHVSCKGVTSRTGHPSPPFLVPSPPPPPVTSRRLRVWVRPLLGLLPLSRADSAMSGSGTRCRLFWGSRPFTLCAITSSHQGTQGM